MPGNAEVLSHWNTLVPTFQTSSLEFYGKVEAGIVEKKLPDVVIERVTYRERGLGSAHREYLRVRLAKLTFDICSAQYGTGHFFSSWMTEPPSAYALVIGCIALPLGLILAVSIAGPVMGFLLFIAVLGALMVIVPNVPEAQIVDDVFSALPYLGQWYRKFFNPETFYVQDIRAMFQKSVHNTVTETIDAILSGQGLRALSPDQSRATTVSPLR